MTSFRFFNDTAVILATTMRGKQLFGSKILREGLPKFKTEMRLPGHIT